MPRLNTTLPDSYGLSLSVYVPTASEANPINTGDTLTWVTTAGYSAAPSADGDAIQLRAKHPVTDPLTPLGVHVYGFSRIERLPYTGTAPALGVSVVSNGADGVRDAGVGITNGSRVLYVDAGAGLVDVALP